MHIIYFLTHWCRAIYKIFNSLWLVPLSLPPIYTYHACARADTPSDDDVETRTNYAISWSQEPSRSQENCLQLPLKYTFFRPIFPRFLVFTFSMTGRIEWVQFGIMFRARIHLSTETAKFLNSSQQRSFPMGIPRWQPRRRQSRHPSLSSPTICQRRVGRDLLNMLLWWSEERLWRSGKE